MMLKRSFKNLDGLRLIAAVFVIVGHSQSILFEAKKISPYAPYFNKLASFGVDFFFVLSGFLISYMLFVEIENTGKINIKNFLIRRSLRLWPLYFTVGILSLATAPLFVKFFDLPYTPPTTDGIIGNFLYLLGFSINHQIMIGHMNSYSSYTIAHFWSLSIEEQFYLLWAPVLYIGRKNTLVVILLFILIGWATTYYPPAIFDQWFGQNAYAAPYYFTVNRYFHFATGALMAWLVVHHPILFDSKKYAILIKFVFIIVLASICIFLFGAYYWGDDERYVNGCISFVLLIMAIDTNSIFNLEYKWLKYLGKISFGIYIYHILGVRTSWKLLNLVGIAAESQLFWILFPLLAIALSVGMAILSFEYFEQYFLRLKKKFY